MDFEKKYENIDIKSLDVSEIDDKKELDWLVIQIGEIIADIEFQLKIHGNRRNNIFWQANARRALSGAKITRQAIQRRIRVCFCRSSKRAA